MFWELIAAIFAAVAAAGVVMMINLLTGGRLPKWAMPVAAGAALLAFGIWNEYTWFARSSAALPEGMEVAHRVETRQFYRPWTYLVPQVSRFSAVDLQGRRRNESAPNFVMVDILFRGRWAPDRAATVFFDCAGGRRADFAEGTEYGDDGLPKDTAWVAVPDGDPALQVSCKEL